MLSFLGFKIILKTSSKEHRKFEYHYMSTLLHNIILIQVCHIPFSHEFRMTFINVI